MPSRAACLLDVAVPAYSGYIACWTLHWGPHWPSHLACYVRCEFNHIKANCRHHYHWQLMLTACDRYWKLSDSWLDTLSDQSQMSPDNRTTKLGIRPSLVSRVKYKVSGRISSYARNENVLLWVCLWLVMMWLGAVSDWRIIRWMQWRNLWRRH